jgi:hypothetical protein
VTPEETQNDAEYKPLSSVYLINDKAAKGYTPPVAPVNTEDMLTVDVDDYELPFD